MSDERLAIVFRLAAIAAQFGDGAIEEIRRRERLEGSDVTDEELAEVKAMTLAEIMDRIKPKG